MGVDYFGDKKNHQIYQIIFFWVISSAYFGYPTISRYLKHNWERFAYEHLYNVHMMPARKPFVFLKILLNLSRFELSNSTNELTK